MKTPRLVFTGTSEARAVQAAETAAAALDAWLAVELTRLLDQAEWVRMAHNEAVEAALQADPGRRRAKVAVRVRRQQATRATPGAFSIEWVRYYYLQRAGTTHQTRTVYIPRGPDDSYPASAFRGLVKPWQLRLILAAEEQMAAIRRQAKVATKVRTEFRRALRTLHPREVPGDG